MALRTTVDEVRSLLQDNEADVFIFMQVANDIVNEWLVGTGLSNAMLKRIESFLACHFHLLSNPGLVREEYDRARYQYVQAKVDEGFRATKWGQMALSLDTSKVLSGANRVQANLYVL